MPAKEQLEIAVGCRGSPGEHGREAGSCGGSGSQLPPAGGLPGGLANLFPRGRGGEEGDGEAVTGRACYVKAPSYRCRQLARIPPNPAAPPVRPLPPSPPRGLPRAERRGEDRRRQGKDRRKQGSLGAGRCLLLTLVQRMLLGSLHHLCGREQRVALPRGWRAQRRAADAVRMSPLGEM